MRDTWVPINISFSEAAQNSGKACKSYPVGIYLLCFPSIYVLFVKKVSEVLRDISPRCDLSCRTPTIQQHTKLLCCEAHLLIHELYPHCETTSRRWAAFSISFVGCLQVLYLGMFGHYSLAFGQLCSHTINNKPSSRGDVCTFVVILLNRYTHVELYLASRVFLTC